MLLVGDLHINARYHEKILTQLKSIFSAYPKEQNIIFFWDYVYHFAYDRNALLQLYNLFIDLFKEGKNVYIIAGNHDRLGSSFVFEEAQKAFDVLLHEKFKELISWGGKIHFVTKPMIETIEWEQILFMPFFLPGQPAVEGEQTETTYTPKNPQLKSIHEFAGLLKKSVHKHEIFSWQINQYVAEQIDKNPNLTIFHHYYINGTAFPGQKAKFNYKDIALHELFLTVPDIKLISGHLHQPFTHTNYLCLGSTRSTSPLEINQNKYIFHYDTMTKEMTALQISVNPQVLIQSNALITEDLLINEIKKINETNKTYFDSAVRNIKFQEDQKINLENIGLTIKVEHIDYDKIDEVIDADLRKTCKDIRLKKNTENLDELLSTFKISSEQLSWFSDWKNVLQTYMQKKFGNDYPKYEKVLKELKLL